MPIYEYQCQICGKKLELIQSINEEFLKDCPKCENNGTLKKLISASSIVVTPPNFFETDWYKSQHKPKPNRMLEKYKKELA